jgi:hypothetical protein
LKKKKKQKTKTKTKTSLTHQPPDICIHKAKNQIKKPLLKSPFVPLAVSPKMKASLKGRYETEKSNAPATAASFAFNAGDVKLRASLTDATVVNGPSLNGLALAVEKPGFFIVDYNVPKKVLPMCHKQF